ncbi:zinc finger MYM-type protein 1-like [Aphis craccivora]|uniref:Zinc finger MYM-type protein 1-like n=1 Tax=Aphis craccivora TaxID=307492 RepID=A0A6G0W285_APHCR|nr:zinc finger MYM-type protein 1-like [Aphis craccivora]
MLPETSRQLMNQVERLIILLYTIPAASAKPERETNIMALVVELKRVTSPCHQRSISRRFPIEISIPCNADIR